VRTMVIRLFFVVLTGMVDVNFAADGVEAGEGVSLPPIETFLPQPIELENVSIWVPAAKVGPLINRSCMAKRNCPYSCRLPANVSHRRTESCPEPLARLLAQYAAGYHQDSMPLTIFNGWQWEYSYSLCEFDSVVYSLHSHGGSWEYSSEAILTESAGSVQAVWMSVGPSGKYECESVGEPMKSDIEISSFSSMRVRDGYPKERDL